MEGLEQNWNKIIYIKFIWDVIAYLKPISEITWVYFIRKAFKKSILIMIKIDSVGFDINFKEEQKLIILYFI